MTPRFSPFRFPDSFFHRALWRRVGAVLAGCGALTGAGAAAEVSNAELRELLEQNRRLQAQVAVQQKTIDELNGRVRAVLATSERHERELRDLREQAAEPAGSGGRGTPGRDQAVRISAEAGLAFFKTGPAGQFPNSEFRVDDAAIAIEAPVVKDTYFFAELKLLTRETNVDAFQLGELYVDFENVSAAWGQPGLLSQRAGRINIPFGEEYMQRSPVANPLISHSLADIWGVDEGVEAYGKVGPVHYVLAVQNGGASRLRDFNSDKAYTARVSWAPLRWLGLSGSAMRTGALNATSDSLSEVWFGGGFFRALGPAPRTNTYRASLFQAEARAHWKGGHLALALGRAHYADDDPLVDDTRRIRFGSVELVQHLGERVFAAARWSEMRAPRGYLLTGWGQMGTFFFRPSLTEELRRLSVGLGWRIGPPLVWKIEYTRERGRMTTGAARDDEDFVGSEIGVRF